MLADLCRIAYSLRGRKHENTTNSTLCPFLLRGAQKSEQVNTTKWIFLRWRDKVGFLIISLLRVHE
jgi:hypothetical protein